MNLLATGADAAGPAVVADGDPRVKAVVGRKSSPTVVARAWMPVKIGVVPHLAGQAQLQLRFWRNNASAQTLCRAEPSRKPSQIASRKRGAGPRARPSGGACRCGRSGRWRASPTRGRQWPGRRSAKAPTRCGGIGLKGRFWIGKVGIQARHRPTQLCVSGTWSIEAVGRAHASSL